MVVPRTRTGASRPGVLLALLCCAAPAGVQAGDFVFADGFDIDLANAYFVSTGGLDTNNGTRAAPFRTIQHGIVAAFDAQRHTVVVAAGSYHESLVLIDGISVYGQYQDGTWARAPDNTTVIDTAFAAGPHLRTVASGPIYNPTTFDGFVVYGGINNVENGNSYALYLAGVTASLRISHNVIFAGRGGPGSLGADGAGGASTPGATYSSALDAFVATGTGVCNSVNNRAAAGGGALVCGDLDDVGGGNGGGNNCTPALSTQASTALSPASAGQAANGGAAGGGAGTRGYDGAFNGSVCTVPNSGGTLLPTAGGDGGSGGDGNDAPGVPGCATPLGSVVDGDWSGDPLLAGGGNGTNGAGGGGGGAGGGAACNGGTCTKDLLGGHGGGGGSGGCGGAGGGGGSSGGGAFAIFITGIDSGTAPQVIGNLLFLGDGGDGGGGGNGGIGALGGAGTAGGKSGALTCTGAGGYGGNGGHGGHGAGGGGGCGGPSFGIYTSGIVGADYCANANNVSVGGFAGFGGAGGLSLGNPGGAGQAGVLAACSFH